MANKLRKNTSQREVIRYHRKKRIARKFSQIRNQLSRLVVFRSNKYLYAQIIDDVSGNTLCQANSREKEFSVDAKSRKNLEIGKRLGKLIAERAQQVKVEQVVFDRNGYNYHGRIKAIAEGAREAGLKF